MVDKADVDVFPAPDWLRRLAYSKTSIYLIRKMDIRRLAAGEPGLKDPLFTLKTSPLRPTQRDLKREEASTTTVPNRAEARLDPKTDRLTRPERVHWS